jgi:hypothetical protein
MIFFLATASKILVFDQVSVMSSELELVPDNQITK